MKTIGLIGGMSWESSLQYYRVINETVKEKLGGLHSGKILMYSVDFDEIAYLMQEDRWKEIAQAMIIAARKLEDSGADFLLLCTNTIHKVAEDVSKAIDIPLLHIADATAEKTKERGMRKIGLLGTRVTMEEAFYKSRLTDKHGLEVLIPEFGDREIVDQVIFKELCLGEIKSASKKQYLQIMDRLMENGAEGIILGCTEIGLLVSQEETQVPLFDTTEIHAIAAVDHALGA